MFKASNVSSYNSDKVMSAKAQDGVVNKWGQSHDIENLFSSDGSQFTTGAAQNPTLTIVSLAIRQAERIASEMSRKALQTLPGLYHTQRGLPS